MTVHYTSGTAHVVVRGDAVVVLPDPVADDVLARLWTDLGAPGAGVAEALGVLTSLGGGLHAVPPFAVVTARTDDGGPGSAHVAVRGGDVKVTVETTSGPVAVDGSDVISWSERVLDGVTAFEAVASGAFARPGLPVDTGVILAGAVRRDVVDAPAEALAPATDAGARPGAQVFAGAAYPVDGSAIGILDALPPFSAPVDVASEDTIAPGHDRPVPAHPEPGDVPVVEAAGSPAATEPAPGSSEPSEATQLGVGEDDYLHLWGATVMRRVEDAAVRVEEEDEDEEEADAPAESSSPPPAPEEAAAPAPASDGDGLVPGVPSLIAGVPREWAGSTPGAAHRAAQVAAEEEARAAEAGAEQARQPEADDEGDGVDHDGNTVMSSAIADLRAAAGMTGPPPQFQAPPTPGTQEILALSCSQGHPNPPSRDACRTCGTALEGDAHPAPRPSLGRVVITGGTATSGAVGSRGGQVVELDRPVVVGRRPRSSTTSASDMPRLVTVSSPQQDISRSHVQITLEDWHVLVADLATTNGTTLMRPGQQPRRLHPNEKELVADGDVVDLGDGVTLTFEGIW
ncbi:FHA domain-containing protein [Antribacter gilvus]|uniref:FHA domain-containing protein n=1 Tax=Antribacter gilvus TaxID=2304675 RepID=UPI000F793EF3|nr:FHA domain-containing protein [Antribacter gilvus]